jgi:radical SAM protein with 4Fe4S-binding SPASM domain
LQYNPVIGADGKVYNCHNKSYTDDGCIGSITNQSFKQMWFSEQTRKYFEEFNPQIHCQCQCANDKKNLFMHELIDCYGDNFI